MLITNFRNLKGIPSSPTALLLIFLKAVKKYSKFNSRKLKLLMELILIDQLFKSAPSKFRIEAKKLLKSKLDTYLKTSLVLKILILLPF